MTTQERAEAAAELKRTGKANCCQSVMLAFQDRLGLDEEMLRKIGAGFAGGMGCMEATCGALVGASVAAGFLKNGDRMTVTQTREILKKFKEKSGATVCEDLKGAKTGKVLCACDDCVRNAVYALDEVIPPA